MEEPVRKRGRPKGTPKTGGRGKGTPKTGGRQKGTPNRGSMTLSDALADIGFSAAEVIAESLEKVSPEAKLEFMHKLLPYLHPQRKPIDPEGYVPIDQVLIIQNTYFELLRAAVTQEVPQHAQGILDVFRHSLSTHVETSQNGSH